MIYATPFATLLAEPNADAIAQTIADRISVQFGATTTIGLAFEGMHRSGATNATIAAAQSKPRSGKWKRNPFFFNQQAIALIKSAAKDLYSLVNGTRQSAIQRVKQAILVTILSNARNQTNPDGSKFTALTPEYARRKAAKFGYKPILEATGDLLGGLRVRVTRSGEG